MRQQNSDEKLFNYRPLLTRKAFFVVFGQTLDINTQFNQLKCDELIKQDIENNPQPKPLI